MRRIAYIVVGALVLVAFWFVVTVLFLDEPGYYITPETNEVGMSESKLLMHVYLNQHSEISTLDGKISRLELQSQLKKIEGSKREDFVLITAHADLAVETVMELQELIEKAGYDSRVQTIVNVEENP